MGKTVKFWCEWEGSTCDTRYVSKAKSCVKTRHGLSQFFVSNVGLRQGENLSPVLFSLFLNDLKGFLTSNNVQGLKLPFALAQDVCLQDIDNFFNFVFIVVRG